jgi:hypothetical protein
MTSTHTASDRRRPWPVTFSAIMLLVQTAILLGVGLYLLSTPPLQGRLDLPWLVEDPPLDHALGAESLALALLALAAAVAFLGCRPGGWIAAIIVQGVLLFTALVARFRFTPEELALRSLYPYLLYPSLLYGVFMVAYLNVLEVRATFWPAGGRGGRGRAR